MPTAILITGLHRSGTSMTANIISKLGVPFDADLLPPDDYNPTGYYESQRVNDLLGSLIQSVGNVWLPADTQVGVPLLNYLTERAQRRVFGIKDPRLLQCGAPVIRTLTDIGCDVKLVVTKRARGAVASSLAKYPQNDSKRAEQFVRDYTPMLRRTRLWAKHANIPVLEVVYELVLKDPRKSVQRISRFVHDRDIHSQRLLAEAESVIDPTLNRSGRTA